MKNISNGVKIGLIAIVINLITVFVYIYQTNLMQEQQHASVWPYVEWKTIYNQNDGYRLKVSNNGIGPALIVNTTMLLNDEVQPNLDSLFSNLIGTTRFPFVRDDIQRMVLPANSSFNLFATSDPQWSADLDKAFKNNKFEMEICYESVYKDVWVSRGVDVLESNCN